MALLLCDQLFYFYFHLYIMQLLKTIFAIVIALIAAFFAIKVVFWMLGAAFAVLGFIFKVAIVALIAAPIFFFVKKKFLTSGSDKYLP